MGSIYGEWADQDSNVLSGIIQTSNNNQITLNAAIAESDHLRADLVSLQPVGLTITPGERVPNVVQAVQGTIGAALGDIGQAGTASQEPGGGGHPCYIGSTEIMTPDGSLVIEDIIPGDIVMAFDKVGVLSPQRVTDKFIHLRDRYTRVTFADGHGVGVTDEHRYWQVGETFMPIRNAEFVQHWDGEKWKQIRVGIREIIKGEVLVFNITVEKLHTYLANGDGVSNLKPNEP